MAESPRQFATSRALTPATFALLIAVVLLGLVLLLVPRLTRADGPASFAATASDLAAAPADYDPVAAGEELPDDFRQLLPRDAIQPIYDPTFVDADGVDWLDDTDVIGVWNGNKAKAYPVSFLNARELVVDEIEGIPILVSW